MPKSPKNILKLSQKQLRIRRGKLEELLLQEDDEDLKKLIRQDLLEINDNLEMLSHRAKSNYWVTV
jgi:hypothetical protein